MEKIESTKAIIAAGWIMTIGVIGVVSAFSYKGYDTNESAMVGIPLFIFSCLYFFSGVSILRGKTNIPIIGISTILVSYPAIFIVWSMLGTDSFFIHLIAILFIFSTPLVLILSKK